MSKKYILPISIIVLKKYILPISIIVLFTSFLIPNVFAITDTIGDTSHHAGLGGASYCGNITASGNGNLLSVGMNMQTGGSGSIRTAIYWPNGTIINQSASVSSATGWNDPNVTGFAITSGTKYILCPQQNGGSDSTYYQNLGGQPIINPLSYGTFPNPAGFSIDNDAPNMRMTYEPAVTNTAPQFYANRTSGPSTYDGSTSTLFNVSWQNITDKMNNAIVTIDGVNKTMTQIQQNSTYTNYGFSEILGAGSHWLIFYGNTTANLWNQTNNVSFSISQGIPSVHISLNVSSPIFYGASSNATCWVDNAYEDSISISSILYRYGPAYTQYTFYRTANPSFVSDNQLLGASQWYYNCTANSGINANWTSPSTSTLSLQVLQIIPNMAMIVQNATYTGSQITTACGYLSGYTDSSPYNLTLYRGPSLVNQTTTLLNICDKTILPVGDTQYAFKFNGSQNFTSTTALNDSFILALNNITAPKNITYSTRNIPYQVFISPLIGLDVQYQITNDLSYVVEPTLANSVLGNYSASGTMHNIANGPHQFRLYTKDCSSTTEACNAASYSVQEIDYTVSSTQPYINPTNITVYGSFNQPAPQSYFNLFGSPLFSALLYSGVLMIAPIIIAIHKKVKIPTNLILVSMSMFFIYFAVSAAGIDLTIILVIVFAVSGMATVILNKLFLGNFKGLDGMLLSYLCFFLLAFTFTNTLGNSIILKGTMPGFVISDCPTSSSLPVIGPLVDFVNYLICGAGYAVNLLGVFFNFSSSVGIVNDVLILGLTYLAVMKFIEVVKP